MNRIVLNGLLGCLFASAMMGCEQPESIVTYVVPTKVPAELASQRQRMLAAMVPLQDEAWFFKVMGPETAVGEVDDEFRSFVEQMKFEEGEPVLIKLPEGWKRGGEKPMRFASLDVDTADKQLDISISKLSRQTDWDQMVLANVNRWRGQVGLDKSTEKWAGADEFSLETIEEPGVWVDIVGDGGSASSMMPPFAGTGAAGPMASVSRSAAAGSRPSMPAGMPPMPSGKISEPTEPMKPDPRVKFERPEGWRDGRMSSMRWAAFNVGPKDAAAEMTVIPAGGDLRGNVARWLGQIMDGQADDEVVDAAMGAVIEVEVDGRPGKRFILKGGNDAKQAIDATIVPMDNGQSIFIKMTGPPSTVDDAAEQISDFLASLKFKSQ